MNTHSTTRFTDRVADYVRWRPNYPPAALQALSAATGHPEPQTIADIGSGTGISAAWLLEAGHTVYAVEPNAAMRAAAEEQLGGHSCFHSVNGTAESIPLPDHSIDGIVACQAFHWFDRDATRREWLRLLKPGGWVALIWNTRRLTSTPFLRAYEALLQEFATDYREVGHQNLTPADFSRFFGGPCVYRSVPHTQQFDWTGLRGRLLSSSYAPGPDHPRHAAMLVELDRIFTEHSQAGTVQFEYDTELFVGTLQTLS